MSALDAVTVTMLVRLFIPSRNIQLTPHCKSFLSSCASEWKRIQRTQRAGPL